MERAAWLERRYGATVDWRPFDLHPEYPVEGTPRSELLARYGGDAVDHMRGLIEGAGFVYDPPDRVPNSNRALRLTELARDRGLHDALHHRLLTGYWSRRRDIGDPEVLVEEAEAVGIPEPDTRAALDSEELAARVDASTRTALRNGVTGVPAWAIDSRLILPGAQPHEVFDSLLRRLGHSPLEAVGESSGPQ